MSRGALHHRLRRLEGRGHATVPIEASLRWLRHERQRLEQLSDAELLDQELAVVDRAALMDWPADFLEEQRARIAGTPAAERRRGALERHADLAKRFRAGEDDARHMIEVSQLSPEERERRERRAEAFIAGADDAALRRAIELLCIGWYDPWAHDR